MNQPISALWFSALAVPVGLLCLAAADAAPADEKRDAGIAELPDAGMTRDGGIDRSDGRSASPHADNGRVDVADSDTSRAKTSSETSRAETSPTGSSEKASAPDRPVENPTERLDRAERAFQNGNFRRTTRLLEPALEPTAAFDDEDSRVRARELLGVGFYFEAQQRTKGDGEADDLMEKSREQFLELLRERPDYELDSLIFPEGAVEIFESVKREHSDELSEIRAAREATGGAVSSGGTEPIYIEREVDRNLFLWNFVPGGTGQFQNRDTVKGVLFGTGQLVTIGVHTFGFFRIQSLCNPESNCQRRTDGTLTPELERAYRWRSAQYFAWGGFGLLYAVSVADALLNYTPREVHIRTRDKPPPELSENSGPTGNGPEVRIGLGGVQIRW
jgi:hypothetical protein